MDYKPPFSLTDEMMSLVADVAELIGHLSANQSHQPSPRLRKEITKKVTKKVTRKVNKRAWMQCTRIPTSPSRNYKMT